MLHRKFCSLAMLLLLLAVGMMAGCNKNYTATDGATGESLNTGVHTLTGVSSRGTPMVFEGLQATAVGNLENPQQIYVAVHGDRGGPDNFLYLAERLTRSDPNLVAVVIARPGCKIEGRISIGTHGENDHYTRDRIDMVARALTSMEIYFGTSNLTALGWSGGSATAALILDLYPGLIDHAILTSLPADVPRWRQHRHRTAGRSASWPNSMSPIEHITNIPLETDILVIVGEKDVNTPDWLAKAYVDAVRNTGHSNIELIVIPGGDHNLRINGRHRRDITDPIIRGVVQRGYESGGTAMTE